MKKIRPGDFVQTARVGLETIWKGRLKERNGSESCGHVSSLDVMLVISFHEHDDLDVDDISEALVLCKDTLGWIPVDYVERVA